jgi:hypothetical protein
VNIKFLAFSLSVLVLSTCCLNAQKPIDNLLPVRGFAIALPTVIGLDSFIVFINKELASRDVNTLLIRVDYKYQYRSHPELVDTGALSFDQVKRIVAACKQQHIRVIPQVNFLGHQSWANRVGKLLQVYPQFDETPRIQIPETYKWPNEDSLYCKSYCPLHPEVHKVLFDLVDEICNVFETDAFHAGLDEVFIIGDDQCPRCKGKDKAALFAGEVTTLYNHLAQTKKELWIWGDRLIDARTTGLGMWEASMNYTYKAVDLIPKKVVICDWHYDSISKTAEYFASKGLRVITCAWRKPEIAVSQVSQMVDLRKQAKSPLKTRYAGVMETVWSSPASFLTGFYTPADGVAAVDNNTQWNCFRAMFDKISDLSKQKL